MKVAIIGTQGVPANYGGFESLVENLLGNNCTKNVNYTVFCSSKDMSNRCPEYKGARLKYIGLHANGAQSILYDILSMIKVIFGYDVILILGVSGCMFLPILQRLTRSKIIVNIDGLEHRRAKWSKMARWFLRTSETMAVRFADTIVADNKGIQDYVTLTYGKPSELIAYGGDQVMRNLSYEFTDAILDKYQLKKANYAITICRIEPENNSHIILEAFSKINKTLVFIGNWTHSEYSRELKEKYRTFPNIHILDAIYDLDVLNVLRSNAEIYVHGHSAGGTNPSLVEAMFFAKPIIAFDCIYNRESTENKAEYFRSSDELINIIKDSLRKFDNNATSMQEIADRRYRWSTIAQQYENLYK